MALSRWLLEESSITIDPIWLVSLFDQEFIYALATVFAGGVIMGFGGFGSGLVLMPLLTLIYSPTHAVAIQMVLVTITGFALMPNAIRHTRWREAGPMLIIACLVMPFGSYLLQTTDPGILRPVIGVVVLVLAALQFRGAAYAGPRNALTATAAGAVSGMANGMVGLGGLIVGLYMVSSRDPAAMQRANIIVVGTGVAAINLVILALSGVYVAELAARIAILMVPYGITAWCGARFFHVTPRELYRKIVLTLVMALGVATLVS
ncbi:MAG: hypothetical protein CL731_04525 [Chloroflexi bacterium]|nr:hypothetical protein [Chloroflexota bacterium]